MWCMDAFWVGLVSHTIFGCHYDVGLDLVSIKIVLLFEAEIPTLVYGYILG